MKTIEEIKRILAEHKEEIREKYGILIVGIFGSYVRGDYTKISDVDVLVKLERPIGFEFVNFCDYLEELLGEKTDVLTRGAVQQKPRLWKSIKEDLIHV